MILSEKRLDRIREKLIELAPSLTDFWLAQETWEEWEPDERRHQKAKFLVRWLVDNMETEDEDDDTLSEIGERVSSFFYKLLVSASNAE